jgi:erythronate-4-phosphate dehydrogenase
MKILVDRNIPYAEEVFSRAGVVTTYSEEILSPRATRQVDALVVRAVTPVNAGIIDGSNIRFVATASSGTDHVDLEYLNAHHIGWASAPGCNANAVAEYVVAALLHLAANHNLKLAGKSLGIIGVGHIGGRVARKAEALGMKVVLNDPPLGRETGDARYRPLEDLLGCDFITLHTPLTLDGIDKTYHLINEKFLSSLKGGSFLINSSRGPVVDSNALKQALTENHLAGAVLDVWENEPGIDVELMGIVDIATPHIAGYSIQGRVAGAMIVYESLCRYFELKSQADIDEFLPLHNKPRILIDPTSGKEEEILKRIVAQVCSIESDDRMLREIESLSADEGAIRFRNQRSTYSLRWEFHHVDVELQPFDSGLAARLDMLGFRVQDYSE